jgi:hypothetical protein
LLELATDRADDPNRDIHIALAAPAEVSALVGDLLERRGGRTPV